MDRYLIIVLIALYTVLAFHNLGNSDSPQTAWIASETEPEAAIFVFEEVKSITRFQFMMGARNDVPFMLYASADGDHWHFAYMIENTSVFAWAERPMHTYARYAQIVPFEPGLRLQEIAFRDQNDNLIMPVMLFGAGVEKLFDEQHLVPQAAGFMNSTYFDEIYHARTGYEYLHGLPIFETTHPPMGKNFIALGIRAFGMTPFGWRFPGTLAGILMIPLMYVFGLLMFRSNFWATFTAFIFTFDFMPFVQTRIATIDSYVTLFILASYLCMYAYCKDRRLIYLAGSGLFIGLAISVKWQGLYAALGLPFIFFPVLYDLYRKNKKQAYITFASCFGFFVAIPLVVYLLSYIPFVQDRDFLPTVIANQQHMFSYHSELLETHPFASRWWEWPLVIRPIFYYANTIDGLRQGISSFGNPAVWWFGIFATFCAMLNWRDKDSQFLLIAYAAQFLPWVFVDRATFIYHYFPSLPFVVLLIVLFFRNRPPRMAWAYGAVVLGLFVLFYPVLAGRPVSLDFVQTFLRWFPAWVLV